MVTTIEPRQNGNRASYPPPLFVSELDASNGATSQRQQQQQHYQQQQQQQQQQHYPPNTSRPPLSPNGEPVFEMSGEPAPPRTRTDHGATPLHSPEHDLEHPVQANPWPFYLEENGTTSNGSDRNRLSGQQKQQPAQQQEDVIVQANPWPYFGPPSNDETPSATVQPHRKAEQPNDVAVASVAPVAPLEGQATGEEHSTEPPAASSAARDSQEVADVYDAYFAGEEGDAEASQEVEHDAEQEPPSQDKRKLPRASQLPAPLRVARPPTSVPLPDTPTFAAYSPQLPSQEQQHAASVSPPLPPSTAAQKPLRSPRSHPVTSMPYRPYRRPSSPTSSGSSPSPPIIAAAAIGTAAAAAIAAHNSSPPPTATSPGPQSPTSGTYRAYSPYQPESQPLGRPGSDHAPMSPPLRTASAEPQYAQQSVASSADGMHHQQHITPPYPTTPNPVSPSHGQLHQQPEQHSAAAIPPNGMSSHPTSPHGYLSPTTSYSFSPPPASPSGSAMSPPLSARPHNDFSQPSPMPSASPVSASHSPHSWNDVVVEPGPHSAPMVQNAATLPTHVDPTEHMPPTSPPPPYSEAVPHRPGTSPVPVGQPSPYQPPSIAAAAVAGIPPTLPPRDTTYGPHPGYHESPLPSTSNLQPPPPLPPRPASANHHSQAARPPGFGSGPQNQTAFPPPPRKQQPQQQHHHHYQHHQQQQQQNGRPPAPPPKDSHGSSGRPPPQHSASYSGPNGGGGRPKPRPNSRPPPPPPPKNGSSSTSSARWWLDKTSQVLENMENKIAPILQSQMEIPPYKQGRPVQHGGGGGSGRPPYVNHQTRPPPPQQQHHQQPHHQQQPPYQGGPPPSMQQQPYPQQYGPPNNYSHRRPVPNRSDGR